MRVRIKITCVKDIHLDSLSENILNEHIESIQDESIGQLFKCVDVIILKNE